MEAVVTLSWPDELQAALKAAGYTPERISEEAMASLAADLFNAGFCPWGRRLALPK